ncbi:MAG: hypothetical protein BGO49_10200 [Planctomycetales bacterium 71-10]|nr:MAG: hypothetical protein BGO49_10200 [Planctomycetales bacterium 71-10]
MLIRDLLASDAGEVLTQTRKDIRYHRPWVHPPVTPEQFAERIRRSQLPTNRSFAICRNDTGAIAGIVNINEIIRGAFLSGYLGYYGFSEHGGRGYMTEGLNLVLAHAFRALKLHRLEANIQPDNFRSLALVRRCGFRREGFSPRYLKVAGRWRDHERFARIREDFLGNRTESNVCPTV